MKIMRKYVAFLAMALALVGGQVLAQGVAPGGGIGNSTGIGSGLGGVIGTGPSYPNGTTQPTLPTPPPPGGYGGPTTAPPAPSSISRPSHYPQPREPFDATTPHVPATSLSLPEQQTNDLSFLRGCWRTDVFQYAQHPGTSTWCFDDKGVGRFLFTRQDQPSYFCRGLALAGYAGQALRLHDVKTDCSDSSDKGPGDLDCHPSGEAAQCSSAGSARVVHLYRVR
jgi:hypothetical protein